MALNLRIPLELDAELDALAEQESLSKSALLLRGARMVISEAQRRRRMDAAMDAVLTDDAALLRRLADA
ncbi:hypothetical protein LG293_17075 (plasmid) [Citricoccus nitrophenolicus]